MDGKKAMAVSKKYTEDTADGMGALKGASCEIQSIVDNDQEGTHTVTYKWVDKNEVEHTDTMVVSDGADGTDGAKGDRGPQGERGEAFEFYNIYDSVSAMQADASNIPNQAILLINTNAPNNSDNGKMYVRNTSIQSGFKFLGNLSNATVSQTVTQGDSNAVSGDAVFSYIDTMITSVLNASY